MDPKNLIRLADAAPRADITLADVLALCTNGGDLHLDVYARPPTTGWSGERWEEEDHLDLPHPDGQGYEGKSEPVGSVCITEPILLPVPALNPWKGVVNLYSVTLGEQDDGHVRSRSYVALDPVIEIRGDLLQVVKHQWAGWSAQHAAQAANADERERLTRRVTAAIQAAAPEQFAWKTEEAAERVSARVEISRQTLSRRLKQAAKSGLPVPARRGAVGRSRADFWLADLGVLVAWVTLLDLERSRVRGGVKARDKTGSKASSGPRKAARSPSKKKKVLSYEENMARLDAARSQKGK